MARTSVLWFLVACGVHDDDAGALTSSDRKAHGEVVARVGQAEVGVEDVREVVVATGLSPREALKRLVAEELLGDQAEVRGYGRSANAARELTKARARALLEASVEAEVTPAQVGASAVQARFDVLKGKLARRQTWQYVRFVVRKEQPTPGLDARALAQDAYERLSVLSDDEVAQEIEAIEEEARAVGATVAVEARERVLGASGLEPIVASALEGMTAAGLVPRVVEGSSTYQVLFVSALLPAREARLEDHEANIRAQLLVEMRAERARLLFDKLSRNATISYDEAAIQRALADDTLLGNLP